MIPTLTDQQTSLTELRPPEPVIEAGDAGMTFDTPKWVLVVCDEPDVLDSVADFVAGMLRSPRIRVRTASSVPEAVDMMAQQFFGLIIADFRPGTSHGVRLLEMARAMEPGVPCVIMCSDPVAALEQFEPVQQGNLVFLAKPIDPAVLQAHAMDALGFVSATQAPSNGSYTSR